MHTPVRIHAVGDVAPKRPDPGTIFDDVRPILKQADFCFGQMECPISERGEPSPSAKLAMRTYPAIAPALKEANFTAMSIAGNHALDFGAVALLDTVEHLQQAGIAPCGGGSCIADARKPALVEVGGQRIATLAYSSILPSGYEADAKRAGCAPLRATTHYEQIEPDQPGTPARVLTFPHAGDFAALIADIEAAKEQADIVLVSFHWGLHFIRAELADYQQVVAHAAIEACADAIIGHHPHLLKAIEIHRGKPIFYSLGNFAMDQPRAFDENIHLHSSFKHLQKLKDGWEPLGEYMGPPETRHTLIVMMRWKAARWIVPCGCAGLTINRSHDCSAPENPRSKRSRNTCVR